MRDPHPDRRQTGFDYSWIDPEFVLYGIVGLVVIGLGARALAHWTVSEWAAGSRVLPGFAVIGVGIAFVALLFVVRSYKRWLYLGGAFAIIALATFLLAAAGLSIPAGWLE
jgi:hypothetical protein